MNGEVVALEDGGAVAPEIGRGIGATEVDVVFAHVVEVEKGFADVGEFFDRDAFWVCVGGDEW